MTPQENILWFYLRRGGMGCKFQRQHSIGPYITDFYCPAKKLVIELDGKQHEENREYDLERTRFLEMSGYKVLRFWNHEANTNIAGVLTRIRECLAA